MRAPFVLYEKSPILLSRERVEIGFWTDPAQLVDIDEKAGCQCAGWQDFGKEALNCALAREALRERLHSQRLTASAFYRKRFPALEKNLFHQHD